MGCNHIKCRCNYEFCYLCGGKWLNYEHRCSSNPNNGQQPAAIQQNEPCCDCLQGENCCLALMRLLLKLLLLPLFLMGVACALFLGTLLIAGALMMTIMMGIFPYTCEFICDLSCPWSLLSVIFYPISMIVGIARAFGDFFCEAAGGIVNAFCDMVGGLAECLLLW